MFSVSHPQGKNSAMDKRRKKNQSRQSREFEEMTRMKRVAREESEIEELEKKKLEMADANPDEIDSFAKFPLSKYTLLGLRHSGFTMPTKVQRQTLIYSLRGMDVVGAAKTGSGKTLAFIIPLLENLYGKKWSNVDGLGALIITPTRELAYQIFEVLKNVGKSHDFSAGLIIGGKDLKYEWKLISGCNILICTPGRLLHHMLENPEFSCEYVQMLILDEADQCLSMGFADTMNCILEELPEDRQTLLFSATQTRDVKDLIRAGCKNPVFCSVHEYSKTATPRGLVESYIVCKCQEKFTFLWSFIRHHRKKKILVFMSTCKQAKYMFDIYCKLNVGVPVLCLHGGMNQLRRLAVYDIFCRKENVVLFATDLAARGLDIPAVDWVVQIDCPEDVTTYIHRVGRTARYANSGEALLVLTPHEEEPMMANLKAKNIEIEKIEVDSSKMSSIHTKMEILLSKYNELKEESVRAFKAYVKSVTLMKDKKVFNVESIDFDAYARSLGLAVTPRLRFLQNQKKQKSKQNEEAQSYNWDQSTDEKPWKSKFTTLDFGSDDIDEEDFLTSTKKEGAGSGQEEEPAEPAFFPEELLIVNSKKKPLTKQAVVKKLNKKNIVLNTKLVFDEEGVEVKNPEKQQTTEVAQELPEQKGGINIAKLKEIMKQEDVIDRELAAKKRKEQKEIKKRKEKAKKEEDKIEVEEMVEEGDEESDVDEATQNIIDMLPDPNKVYGDKTKDSDDDSDDDDDTKKRGDGSEDSDDSDDKESAAESSEEDSSSEESEVEKKVKISGKRKALMKLREAKRARLAQTNSLSNLPVEEKEQLALFLLRGGGK
ncbi:probable ATP-dependent RNA helicase DDX10 [Penaeus japonicus]|uniref:probable ATP-dependent RNA helicase DDX10 n=1 Tax=Penaeus japonicus TaxID=27405 RepID=UPI001C71302A|nr:probable ATP-dependent RNA helicase DDX10 [Penaeus japonicus]